MAFTILCWSNCLPTVFAFKINRSLSSVRSVLVFFFFANRRIRFTLRIFSLINAGKKNNNNHERKRCRRCLSSIRALCSARTLLLMPDAWWWWCYRMKRLISVCLSVTQFVVIVGYLGVFYQLINNQVFGMDVYLDIYSFFLLLLLLSLLYFSLYGSPAWLYIKCLFFGFCLLRFFFFVYNILAHKRNINASVLFVDLFLWIYFLFFGFFFPHLCQFLVCVGGSNGSYRYLSFPSAGISLLMTRFAATAKYMEKREEEKQNRFN